MAKKDIKNAHCNKLAGKQFYPKRDSTQLAGKKAGVPVLVSLQVLLLWGGCPFVGSISENICTPGRAESTCGDPTAHPEASGKQTESHVQILSPVAAPLPHFSKAWKGPKAQDKGKP